MFKPKKQTSGKFGVLTEDVEQKIVVIALERFGILFTHVPNGGNRGRTEAARLKGQGVKAGVPDLLIFDPPPAYPDKVGMALEMKRVKGSVTSPDQKAWIEELTARNWIAVICKGSGEALDELQRAGYFKAKGAR